MAKFVDKQNLAQYKYFNNLVGKDDMVKDIASNYIVGDHQLSNRLVQNNPREYRDSLLMLNKGKRDLPGALYSLKEDQERCYNEIFYGSARQIRQNANRYIDMLLFVHFFQGERIGRSVEADPEMLEGLSEREKNRKYEFNREDGKFYSSFFSVPKLVLVNKDLFTQHLERDLTEEDMESLGAMLPRDVHYFMVSLFLQQLYREMLSIADEHGGKLPNRVMVFADEIGTIPKIESMEMMFSAGRSRRISMVPIIQSFAQLQKNYGKEGSSIIIDNCQDILFGGFAPNSESADILSKALGNRTVLSGSISRGKNDPSQSLQMMSRPLMSPDELKTLPKGHFILAKTGCCPMQTRLPLFLKWGIVFGEAYEVPERAAREVYYADRFELEQEIVRRRDDDEMEDEEPREPPLPHGAARTGGQSHAPAPQEKEHPRLPRRMPLRTD